VIDTMLPVLRRPLVRTVLGLALAVSSLGAYAQQMYRWVDRDGRVQYSDRPPVDAPKGVQQRSASPSVVETSTPDYATAQAIKNHPVSLYTAPNCKEICGQARDLLAKRGVPFSEISVTDEKTRTALNQVSGDTQVPVLVVGKDVTKGFEAGAFNSALDTAGYPKTASPGAARAQQTAAAAKASAAEPKPADAEPARPKGRYLP
jgi:glutaredoxin